MTNKKTCEACKCETAVYRWLNREGQHRNWCGRCFEPFSYNDAFYVADGRNDIVKTWTLSHATQDWTGIPLWESAEAARQR